MERKEYLNEEKTQKTNKTLFFMGITIILLGIIVAMIMIVPKIINSSKTNTAQLQQKLNQLKPSLEKDMQNYKQMV